MHSIHALIFDMDGVVVDSAVAHYEAWRRVGADEGIFLSDDEADALRGLSRRDSLLAVLKGRVLSEYQMAEWMERKDRYFKQSVKSFTAEQILPGVLDLLREAKSAGLRIGLGSSSQNAHEVLAGLGLTRLFDVIGDSRSVANTKPAPDIFVWVAGGLDVSVTNTLVLEDAESGVEAAHRAGMRVVGLGDRKRVGRADRVLPSLDGIRLADLLAGLAD